MRRFRALALAACLLLGTAPPAAADLDSDLTQVRQRIQNLRSLAGENRHERTDAVNALFDVAAELEAAAAVLAQAEAVLAATDAEIAVADGLMEELEGRIAIREAVIAQLRAEQDSLRDAVQRRAVELYMSASEDALLPARPSDLSEARVGLAYAYRVQESADVAVHNYEALQFQEARQVGLLVEERALLEHQVGVMEAQRAEQATQREAVAVEAEAVRTRVAEQQAVLDRIDREISDIEGEIASLAREESRIRAVIAAEQSQTGTAPGVLVRPVPGAVTSGYGYRTHPIYGDQRLHTGWDMTAGCGVPIKAGASGRVILSAWYGGYGNTIMIDHGGGMSTLYAHQSSLGASYNQQVSAGQVIGWIGTTGLSTGCHLHFEVRINGNPVNPSPFM